MMSLGLRVIKSDALRMSAVKGGDDYLAGK